MKITVVNPDEITDSVERNEIENIKKELNEEIQAPEVFEVEIPQEEKAPIIKEKKKLKPLFDSKTKEVKINSRTFTIQNWKGKNRRKFMEIFSKENKDIDLAIFEALIKDVISPNDIWLTEFELKYILSEIRILTFGDKTEFAWTCNNAKCQKRNITTGTISELYHIKNKKNTPYIIDNLKINFKEEINFTLMKDILVNIKNPEEKKLYEMMCYIDSIQIDEEVYEEFTIAEVEDFLDSLDSKIYYSIFQEFLDNQFQLDLWKKYTCEACGKTTKVTFDEIPDFMDPWTIPVKE